MTMIMRSGIPHLFDDGTTLCSVLPKTNTQPTHTHTHTLTQTHASTYLYAQHSRVSSCNDKNASTAPSGKAGSASSPGGDLLIEAAKWRLIMSGSP